MNAGTSVKARRSGKMAKGSVRSQWLRGLPTAILLAVLPILALFLGSPAFAADKRVALVIGNAAYSHTAPLANPRNDAEDVAATLRGAGFQVLEGIDLDKAGMDDMLARFARQAEDADAALIFYAGHGMQIDGQNVLVPVDAELKDEISIRYETTPLADVTNAFVRVNGMKILILDACRNNPLAERLARNQTLVRQGFARISSPRGMLVASATQADELAYDGSGRNSVFTSALVAELREPGLEIHELFRRVAVNVSEESGGRQLPETSSSLAGSFYFRPGETDESAWLALRTSRDVAELNGFIETFPSSLLADAAKARIALIEVEAREQELRDRIASLRRTDGDGAQVAFADLDAEASAVTRNVAPTPAAVAAGELDPEPALELLDPVARVAMWVPPESEASAELPPARQPKQRAPKAAAASAPAVRAEPKPEPPALDTSEPSPGLTCAAIIERAQLGGLTPGDAQLLTELCQ
jgi:uncharacterized caspase-like protein